MKKEQHYTFIHKLSSLLMLLMLAWLTVCLPYVAQSNVQLKNQIQITSDNTPDADSNNPLSSTTEEKSESGVSVLSEYLHHLFQLEQTLTDIGWLYQIHPSELYHAYHPDLIIPPPEA